MKISLPLFRITVRNRRGLTLVEILITVVLFAIIATTLFVSFKAGLDSWRKTQSHLEMYQSARVALDMITRDLSAAFMNNNTNNDPSSNLTIMFRGFDTASRSGWVSANSAADEVFFTAALNPSIIDPNVPSDLCKVGYWLDGKGTALDTSDDELMRYYYAQLSTATPIYRFYSGMAGTSTRIADNITGLEFRFFDSTRAARTTWDSTSTTDMLMSGRLPTMVEVRITVRDPSSATTMQFLTNIFIPNSQR